MAHPLALSVLADPLGKQPLQPYRHIFDFLRRAGAAGPAVLRDLGLGGGRGRG